MKLPIRNRSDKPLTLFFEPWCNEHVVPPGGEALLRFDGAQLHSIDVEDGWLTIWEEGSGTVAVEVIGEEHREVADTLGIARGWLHRLGGQRAVEAMVSSLAALEEAHGHAEAHALAFTAFRQGFEAGKADAPWTGPPLAAPCYEAGARAARLNRRARWLWTFPGWGKGPFDTDTIRTAFARASALIARAPPQS
jgi:hypothetical protein